MPVSGAVGIPQCHLVKSEGAGSQKLSDSVSVMLSFARSGMKGSANPSVWTQVDSGPVLTSTIRTKGVRDPSMIQTAADGR